MPQEDEQNRDRVRLRVVGRVQGVGFRHFVRSIARALDMTGWVRNEDDGSVLIVAEGSAEALRSLMSTVAAGPRSGHVQNVVEEPIEDSDPLPLFEIRYY